MFSGCMFIDFSKGYNTIDHHILAQKLDLYGLDSISQKFMLQYMSSRKHSTTAKGHESSEAPVTYSTVQGSILGPLIFILYVNDIFDCLDEEMSIFMYADDTLILSKSEDIYEVAVKSEQALEKIMYWSEVNKLSINYKKTKYMTVKHTKVDAEPNLNARNSCTIGSVQQYEYLGMLLDNKLTMN